MKQMIINSGEYIFFFISLCFLKTGGGGGGRDSDEWGIGLKKIFIPWETLPGF